MIKPTFSRDVVTVTDLGRDPAVILCVAGWENRNIDAWVNNADNSSTFDKNLVNFGPLTPKVCRR